MILSTGWVKPPTKAPGLVWDDSGTGGKRGSFWIANSLQTLFVTDDHNPPKVCRHLLG